MAELHLSVSLCRPSPGSPLVIVQWAAVRLQITPQAVEATLKELGQPAERAHSEALSGLGIM